ncbi:PREDICTED: nuclear receptor-binding factor 2-like isoform X1 [Habropoda laboriosa]|uniref:nuclear receptor-binding factor 2-like isoform X1 n=2 Tax=Habropoda laboriosa TaxID=597456 RepID=UPI00083E4E81|nr:PREDICTED: nuclear receptor-binding factor 2-like isoform X1 [Habropoda laboriosa]
METSVLNAAHKRQRRAEALLQEGRFEEAAKCHETVASLLGEAHAQLESDFFHLKTSNLSSQIQPTVITSFHSLITLESLALQRDYHKRQAAVVRMKQAQYEEYKATLENQKREILSKQARKQIEKDTTEFTRDKFDGSLSQAIYKTIEEQDSLLTQISLPNSEDKVFKHPKDASTVIEELKTVNGQLRYLVGSLLNKLEAKEEEVRQLTEQLQAVTANPNDETRLDNAHFLRLAPLPPLTPLEMPLFDFTSTGIKIHISCRNVFSTTCISFI